MLNSVAKYLFGGSSSDHGQEYSNKDVLDKQHSIEEHLETQQEEDWVVVRSADKENSGQPAHRGPHLQHTHHYHHGHTHHLQSYFVGGHDSLSQNSSSASEAELLDDAAALAQSISTDDPCHSNIDTDSCSESVLCPLHDCGWANQDLDRYSDTESLPESVFSACSGRSHATYHPCGSRSEPWVVAPPPCFTGSKVGGLSPVASSPLENLLIEHPSMSVYLSFPPSHPILFNRPTTDIVTSSLKEKRENGESNRQQQVMTDQILNVGGRREGSGSALQQRNTHAHAAIHPQPVLPHQLLKSAHMAQCVQCMKAKKAISKNKCEQQNKVMEYRGHAKGNNRRNKRVRPSGFKSSRFSQHM